jgi:long-chain acyl-CoA synthetase
VLSHRDLVQEAEATMAKIQLSAADRLLYVASPSRTNSFGSCLIAAIAAGATLVILETSDWDEILPVLAGEQVTIFAGTASLFTRLTENAPDKLREIPSLRWCFCAGPPLPPEIGERLYRRIGINIEQLASHFDSSTPQRA